MEIEAMERSLEFSFTIERMRVMFFGRPSQQIRLQKRDCQVNISNKFLCVHISTSYNAPLTCHFYQIERNKSEYYCSAWRHLMEDSEEERRIEEDVIYRATKKKSDTAARADALRGKEKGACQAALYLRG